MLPPAEGTSAFAILGLPERFGVAQAELDEAYRRRQREFHPDRFAGADAATREASLAWSTAVNDAYRALRDPANRAIYLLTRHGFGKPFASKAKDEAPMPQDPAFLEKVMAIRERQMEAETPAAAAALAADVEAQLATLATAVFAAMTAADGESDVDRRVALWRQGEDGLVKYRYLQALLRHLRTLA